ncbi:MAG: hypothetical protein AAFS10_27075 [Myxococcota bacterium]
MTTQPDPHSDPLPALHRWIAALNEPDNRLPYLIEALTPDAEVYRYGVWEEAGQRVDTFCGPSEVADWFARTPVKITFALASSPTPHPERPGAHMVRFSYHFDDFSHGGRWIFGLADDGRLRWVEHHPEELPPGNITDTPRPNSEPAE